MSRFPVYTQESISEYCLTRPNLDCSYTYPSNFAPNKIPFGAKYGLINNIQKQNHRTQMKANAVI